MADNMFSWQKGDFEKLCIALTSDSKVLFIHTRDFESPFHVLTSFSTYLTENEYALFDINASAPYPSYPLLPFSYAVNQMLGQNPKGTSLLPNIVKDLTKSDTIAAIIERISNEHHHSTLLTSIESDLLIQMECAANGNIPIFLFYGYPFFDRCSKSLTALLVSGLLNDDFPYLKNAKFLFVCEDDTHPTAFREIAQLEHIDISLTNFGQQDMPEIVAELTPELQLTIEEQTKLFYLSGGRLSIIDTLLRYLVSEEKVKLDSSAHDLIDATLSDRIFRMGTQGVALQQVLECAANIGKSFYIPLLKHIVDSSTCDKALEKSGHEFFTTCTPNIGRFVYREIWNFFYACEEKRKCEISRKIERAIYYFNPYDYATRAHYLEEAGDIYESCELYYFAYNAIIQEGISHSIDIENKIESLSRQCGLLDYWHKLCHVYSTMSDLDYKKSIGLLESMDPVPTLRLLLLKEYLTALCLHRLGDTLDNQKESLLSMKEATKHAKDTEDGFWCDCQMAQLSFLVNSGEDIDIAKHICKELTYYYTTKSYAPFAQKGIYALKRKWSALYSVEKAVLKTEESVQYFRCGKYPSQYLMALNNHAANLIVLGKYAAAMEYLGEAMGAIQCFPTVSVNKAYLLNNYYLCAVLAEEISPAEAYKKLYYIIEQKDFGDWAIIPKLNCAIYMALAGELSHAEEALRVLEKISLKLCDDYYIFYVYANLAAVLYLQGESTKAVSLLQDHCLQPPLLLKATERVYMEERVKEWISVMETTEIENPHTFDIYLLDRHPAETQWSSIGRGFLYSDIQFWSEP